MGTLGLQLRQVLRRLAHTPTFTAITLLTLAIAIGANTAIFSVLDSVLLRPLPYPHADRLVGVWHAAAALNLPDLNMSPSNYFVYREQNRAFEDVGIYQNDAYSVTGQAGPEQVRALDVTDGVLPLLGVHPALGRLFTRADDSPASPHTVVLSYGYWQRRMGADPAIVGRTLTADGVPRQIIGVLPRGFTFLDATEAELFMPMRLDRAKTLLGQFNYEGVARLKPGITLEQANADVERMLPIVLTTFQAPPGFDIALFEKAGITANVRPLVHDVIGDVGGTLWILMAGIGLVLLIACANVANLLLVRAEGRQHELAIRAALGASRGRIAAELLFESLVIGLIGGALGLGLAYWGLELLVSLQPAGLPRLAEIGIDRSALLFTLAASVGASLFFGCVPILRYAGLGAAGLGGGGRTYSDGRDRHRARNALVVVQVGLAFVLLVCAGLMIRTFRALTHVDPGFTDPAGVQTFRFYIPESDIPEPDKVVRAQRAIRDKIAALPGVTSVALSTSVPMDGDRWSDPVFAEDRSYAVGELPPLRRFRFISPELLATLGIPLVAGRNLTWADLDNKTPVVLVSAGFAREYWHDPATALGKRVRVSSKDEWREIIGVVGDVHDDGLNQEPPRVAYWPLYLSQFDGEPLAIRRSVTVSIRGPRAGSESLMKEVREAVWSVDGSLPLARVRTLDTLVKRSMARTSFTLVMLGLAGAMALLLGVVGLYGVIAYSVSKRTREIGIRMALGAKAQELTRLFVRQGLLLSGAGVAFGVAVALATVRFMTAVLFGVSAVDPLTYVAVGVGLLATAALASWVPSRRAAAVDPMAALRSE
jgi:predicted permease